MDRLNQLRGEAGCSRDSTLDTSAATSEAFMTANESSKYFSLSEEDSSFDITPIKDISLASTADPEKAITGTDQLISTLSPNTKKNDLLDSYKFDKQIEAANILSGGVDIFDDNDNSYDGHELVIDDNAVDIDDKSNSELKTSEGEGEGEGVSFQKAEKIPEPAIGEEISQPAMGAEISEPVLGEEISEPAIVEEISQPAIGEEISEPALGQEVSEPAVGEEVSEPAMGEEMSQPLIGEAISEPIIVDEVSGQAIGEELLEQAISEEISEPAIDEELSQPSMDDEMSQPSVDEEISQPAMDEEMSQPAMDEPEPTIVSKDTEEVVLQIDGKNVNAIDIGNGLYLYRKHGEEELAAVQVNIDDDQQQPSFKFLKVRENAEGNLEVYEEIEVEVPVEEEKPEQNASHVPIPDTNDSSGASTSNQLAERRVTPQEDMAPESSKRENVGECSKDVPPEKPDVNINGKMVKFNETRKSPVIHSTPNKEGIPLTKTMVDQQLHPSRHSDNVKTIEVHTDSVKQRIVDVQPKNKDDENKDSVKEKGECSKQFDGTKQNELNRNQEVKKQEKKKEASELVKIEMKSNNSEEIGNKQCSSVSGEVEFAKSSQKEEQEYSTVSSKVEATRSPQKQEPAVSSQHTKSGIINHSDLKMNEGKEKHEKFSEPSTSTVTNNSKEITERKVTGIRPLGIEENVDDKSMLLERNIQESSNKMRDNMQPLKEITQLKVKTLIHDSEKIRNADNVNKVVSSTLNTKSTTETSQYQEHDNKKILEDLTSHAQQTGNKEIESSARKISKNPTQAKVTQKPVNKQVAQNLNDNQASNINNMVKKESTAKNAERKIIEVHKDSFAKKSEQKLANHGKLQNISLDTISTNENPKHMSVTYSEQPKNLEYRAVIPVAAKTIEEPILSNIGLKESVKPQISVVETNTVAGKPDVIQHLQNKQSETKDLDFTKGSSASTSVSTINLKAEALKITTSHQKRSVVNKDDNLTQKIEVKNENLTVPNQTPLQNNPEVKNKAQIPINNNHTAVPFGQWTPANRQEFLNKIKETKVPVTSSSNTKQIKKTNDLNRRDVLQKIDSQRQSNTAAAKAQELPKSSIHSISQPSIKAEMKTFVSKQIAPCDNKVSVKAEAPTLQIKSVTSKKPAKQEPLKTQSKLPIPIVAASEVPKKDISQRKEINNQDLIDRTIEGIINKAVSAKHSHEAKPNLPRQPFQTQTETPTPQTLKISTKDSPVTCLDAIEKKMNELHGIPFVERPAHELPKLYNHDKVKTYARSDSQKIITSKPNKIPNLLPFTGKTQHKIVKDNIIEVDSEEEIIEHEPVTGDIDKNNKNVSKLPSNVNETIITKTASEDTKKESIITEKDFDKFARRNSKTYENCLTVNFEHKDQPNVVQTVVERDVHYKKYSRNELLLAEAKVKSYQKQKSSQSHNHPSKIQITSKLVPVADDTFNKNFPSKLQLAYQTALTTKRQMESPITIIEDKPVKVVFMDTVSEFAPTRLNVQGQELSPSKKPSKEADCVTISTCDSLDSDVLDSVDALDGKARDETKSKIKHQRKQVLTPVETPELELIEPGDLGITVSPKKRRKLEDMRIEKSPKTVVPKKSYLLGRNAPIEGTIHKDLPNNILTETVVQASTIVTHKNTTSAIDNLVLAAELLETQSETLSSTTTNDPINMTITNSPQQNTPVKRGRGRPRKYPLPEGAQTLDKVKIPVPQKKPRLIDAMRSKRRSTTEEEDDFDTSDDEIVKENWTMGKINENIVCPICNKLFRSENVVFKHVKHCSGPSPNRSTSDKRSPTRRSRMSLESESKSRESKSDDTDFEDEIPLKKTTPSKRRSEDSSSVASTDQDDVIVIEDMPLKEKPGKRDSSHKHDSRKAAKITHNASNLTCEFCGKAFRQLSHLVNHKLQHKKEELKNPEDDTKSQDKKVFSCEICKKEFRKLHHLVQHRLIHNLNNAPHRTSRKSSFEQFDNKTLRDQEYKQTDDQTAGFRCEPCDKSFRKLHHLVEHRETHDGINRQKSSATLPTADKPVPAPPPPQCDICKKTFRKLHHLIEHKEQHIETNSEKSDDKSVKSSLSTKDIIHECSLCYMVFPNEHSLNKHTIICLRKKRQSATKQTKPVEENEANEQMEEAHNSEEYKQIEVIEPTNTNLTLQENTEIKEQELITVESAEQPKINDNIQLKPDINPVELKMQPTKRDLEEPEKLNAKETTLEVPTKIMKVDEKEKLESENTPKEVTLKKKIKDKDMSSVTKRQKLTFTAADEKLPVVESSDEEEVRYMLNPAFKLEDKEEKFMKVRAKKRSSLQIERPNSKDREINIVKRRTSLQNLPKIARLKPKPLGTKIAPASAAPTKTIYKTLKSEPASSTDSDDSEVKYSFPKFISEEKSTDKPKQEIEITIKETRKLLAQKRKSLIGLAKKKSLGQMLMAKNKHSPAKQTRRRNAEVEHRCDCGQLFSSAALLSRHTTLAHTPPRIRKRRSSPPAAPPPPTAKLAAAKPAAANPAVAKPAAAKPAAAKPAATKPAVVKPATAKPATAKPAAAKPAAAKPAAAKPAATKPAATKPAATKPAAAKPAAVKPATAKPVVDKNTARKSGSSDKNKFMDSRKSSVRSDVSASTNKTKKPIVKETKTSTRRGKVSDKSDVKSSTTSKPKSNAAHRGVPMPEKMRKIASKLK